MKNKFVDEDILYPKAKKLAKKDKNITSSEIQEALKTGYIRTIRLMDMLKEDGVIKTKKPPTKATIDRLYNDKDWKHHKNKPVIPLGAQTKTHNLVGNLTHGFNLIIAGQTGSGKSNLFHCAMFNLLKNTKTDEIQFILIDPKQVEFSLYGSLPNLVLPVAKTGKEAKEALKWCLKEIRSRLKMLKDKKVFSIADYNNKHKKKISRIVIMIDECAGLMWEDFYFFKEAILKILKHSYFTSVNILIATSRPSITEVYPQRLVDAFDFRIAFKTSNSFDSTTMLGLAGAEKLQGKGDMLLKYPSNYELAHLQGFYVNEKKVKKLVASIKP
jgi:S-DNA-T family DNA segregation ATPase FtsK/SpoIIIE